MYFYLSIEWTAPTKNELLYIELVLIMIYEPLMLHIYCDIVEQDQKVNLI